MRSATGTVPTRADFQLRASQGHAKQPIVLNGWVAEWFKAPVLKADHGCPCPSCRVPSGLIFSGFLAQQEPYRAALYRLVPCNPVPIPVPKLLALFCRVFGHRWEVNDAYAARA